MLQDMSQIITQNDNTTPLTYHGEITVSKIDEMYPIAISNQISTVNAQIWFGEIYSLSYCPDMKMGNYQNLPIGNPEPDLNSINAQTKLVKIHWHLLKLSFENKNMDML